MDNYEKFYKSYPAGLQLLEKNGRVVYLSGSITKDKNFVEKFTESQKKYEDLGYLVYNPVVFCNGITKWSFCMRICYEVLKNCHFVVILDDERVASQSKGVRMEALWSKKYFKIPVIYDYEFNIHFSELDYNKLINFELPLKYYSYEKKKKTIE